MSAIVFVVGGRESGQTLAAVLKSRYGISWAQAKRLIERRHVKIGGQVETDIARRLKPGKRVELAAGTVEGQKATSEPPPTKKPRAKAPDPKPKPKPKPKPSAAVPSRPPAPSPDIEIVFADEHIVVVNKPVGLTTMRHEEEAAEFGKRGKRFLPRTLADHLPGLLGRPDRPVHAVHRIDRDTSGLVVFAQTRLAAESLTRQFRKHTAERRYLALTRGVPPAGRIESTLIRDRGDGRRGSCSQGSEDEEGKRAVTHVKVLESRDQFALVECRLETGRTHQVRIHLGEAGTPLCGERLYDRPVNGKPVPDASTARRPMLHAARLGFDHPVSRERASWDAPPPEDFRTVREVLGLGRA